MKQASHSCGVLRTASLLHAAYTLKLCIDCCQALLSQVLLVQAL